MPKMNDTEILKASRMSSFHTSIIKTQLIIIAKLEKRIFNQPIEDIIDPIAIFTNISIIDSNKPVFFII